MKILFSICFSVFVFAGGSFGQTSGGSMVPGKVIVRLKPDAASVSESRLRASKRSSSDTSLLSIGLKSFDKINRRYRARGMRRVFPDAGKYEAKHRKYGLHLWYEISIPEDEDPSRAAEAYGSDENISVAEPGYRIRRSAGSFSSKAQADIPNDPDFGRQWHYNNTGQTGGTPGADIRLLDAWGTINTLGIRNRQVIVAVTDGGVYYDHEDLHDNMWVNEAELNGTSGVDDDGNGYADDIHGFNFVQSRRVPIGTIEPEDHATHVAGTIAAVTRNGKGVSGISGGSTGGFGIKVMTIQVLNNTNGQADLVEAFTYAADNGAVISQNSWAYENPNVYSQRDLTAIDYFINEAGRDENGNPRPGTPMVGGIVIFAAGNESSDDKWYPSYYDKVVAVAAVDHNGKLTPYSNYGDWVDISAPGGFINNSSSTGGVYSTSYRAANKNYYEYMDGTSMACPHVSGVAALILSVYGNETFTPDMLRVRLLNTATPATNYDPAHAAVMGAGLVNANEAVLPGGIPGKITDLTVNTVKSTSVQLSWTVPAVENNGKVVGFVTARATEPITEINFSRYAENSVSSTIPSGGKQTYTVTGLTPATTWYTAVRSIGNLGDESAGSDVVQFVTDVNHAPEVVGFPSDTTLIPHATPIVVDLSKYIIDPDGDGLTFDYTVDQDGIIINVSGKGSNLTIAPLYHGLATIHVTARDAFSATATATMNITVEQKYAPDETGVLLVYPNPTYDILHYSFIPDKPASAIIRVVNTAGGVMYQTEISDLPEGAYYDEINLSDWIQGVYIMQLVIDGKKVDAKKFIKL